MRWRNGFFFVFIPTTVAGGVGQPLSYLKYFFEAFSPKSPPNQKQQSPNAPTKFAKRLGVRHAMPLFDATKAPNKKLAVSTKQIREFEVQYQTICMATKLQSARPEIGSNESRAIWLFALSPYVVAFVLITMAIHVRVGLGHWPTPMTENYQTFAFEIHEWTLIVIGIFAIFVVGPFGLLLLLLRSLRGVPQVHAKHVAVYFLGWVFIIFLAKTDPTTFTAWFLD